MCLFSPPPLSRIKVADVENVQSSGNNISDLGYEVLEVTEKFGKCFWRAEEWISDCIAELADAEGEIMKRKFNSGEWSKDESKIVVEKCCAMLKRAMKLETYSENFSLQSGRLEVLSTKIKDIQSWAKSSGLVEKMPKDLAAKSYDTSPPSNLCAFCDKPAFLKCTNCRLVSYCDKKHQREDWFNHRVLCHAGFEVCTTVDLGPHLVASRNLKKDDVILVESPLVVGPRHAPSRVDHRKILHSEFDKWCVGCCCALDISTTTTCPANCKWPVCNRMCPGLKNNHTSTECYILSKIEIGKMFFQTMFLALRCVLLEETNPEKWKWFEKMAPFATARLVDSNKRHDQISALAFVMNSFSNRTSSLPVPPTAVVRDWSIPTIKQVFAILDVYSLCWIERSKSLLSALYPNASLLQHSCCSNTRPSFEERRENGENAGRVTLKALKDIRKGEVLTYASTFHLASTLARQEDLLFCKNIRCSCPRCLDPRELGTDFSTLKCTDCSDWLLPIDTRNLDESDWKCQGKCGSTLSARTVKDRVVGLQNAMNEFCIRVQATGSLSHVELKKLETLLETYLHPNHDVTFALKYFTMAYVGIAPHLDRISTFSDSELEIEADSCRQMLKVIDQLGPSVCQAELMLISTLFKLAKSNAELTKRRLASGHWTKEQAASSVSDCRKLLQRAFNYITLPNVPDADDTLQVYSTLIRNEEQAILSWAKKNCLQISE